MAEATAERVLLGGEILKALAHAVAANEKAQRRFRAAVMSRLAKIETMVAEALGAQFVQHWPPGKVSDEQRAKWVQEVEARISTASDEMGLKMVKYIYGEAEGPSGERKTRRKRTE